MVQGVEEAGYQRKGGMVPLRGRERIGRYCDRITSHTRKGGSFRRMNRVGKGMSCRGEGDLLLLLLFAGK